MVMDFLGKFNLNWLSTVLTPALPPFWRGSGLPLSLHFSTGFYKIYLIQLSNFGWRRNHRGTAKTIATAYSSPFKHKKSTALKSRDHIRKKTALHKALAAVANFTYPVRKHPFYQFGHVYMDCDAWVSFGPTFRRVAWNMTHHLSSKFASKFKLPSFDGKEKMTKIVIELAWLDTFIPHYVLLFIE